jgi:hypothetical protein
LKVNIATISRDLSYPREQVQENIKKYVNERLPIEYEKCLVGLTSIMKESLTTSNKTDDANSFEWGSYDDKLKNKRLGFDPKAIIEGV